MKRIFNKLGSKKGETLIEILVAVIIIALAAGLFAAMYSASMNINVEARKQDEAFYKAMENLEDIMNDGSSKTSEGTLNYKPTGDNSAAAKSPSGADIYFYTEDGVTVYYEKE